MKIINPVDNDIKVMISGVWYEVEANGELSNVPAEAATYWKTMLHPFLQVVEDAPAKALKEEAPKEEAPEEEELIEEKPEAKKASKKVTK